MTLPLALCTLDRSPLFEVPEDLPTQIEAAAQAGFTHLSVDIFSLRARRDAGGRPEALGDLLAQQGMAALDVSGINIGEDPRAALDEADEAARFASALGAPWVQTRVTSSAPRALEVYRVVAARLAEDGLGASLEFSGFTPVGCFTDACRLIEATRGDGQRHGVVVDTWHLLRGGAGTVDEIRVEDVAYLQLADASAPGSDARHDTMQRRAAPGEGELALTGVLTTLFERGYRGVVAVEVLSEQLRRLEAREYAAHLYRRASEVLAAAQAAQASDPGH